MYPIPILTRDVPGYLHHAAYRHALEGHHRPALSAARRSLDTHIGTIFHEKLPDGSDAEGEADDVCAEYRLCIRRRHGHVAFGRSVAAAEVKTRDSILLTYFVDAGALRISSQPRQAGGQFRCATNVPALSAIVSLRRSASLRHGGLQAPSPINALTRRRMVTRMVTRKRFRSILTALGLYVAAALLIGYFGVNAYTGNHGLKAKQDLDQQIAALTTELDRLKPERSMGTAGRVAQVRQPRSRHAGRARARAARLRASPRPDA